MTRRSRRGRVTTGSEGLYIPRTNPACSYFDLNLPRSRITNLDVDQLGATPSRVPDIFYFQGLPPRAIRTTHHCAVTRFLPAHLTAATNLAMCVELTQQAAKRDLSGIEC